MKPLNQNKMNQTAVEWFVEEMFNQGYFNDKPMTVANINYFANIAKEMEKEQIIDAYQQAEKDNGKDFLNGDLYYNETFKSGKQSYQDKMRDKITKAKSRIKWNL
jgi:hypothetical protein